MNSPTSFSGLSSFEAALQALLAPLSAVTPHAVAVRDALGRIAAGEERSPAALPAAPVARVDGWACQAVELIGASSLAPVMLAAPPLRVEVGQILPPGCDAVLPAGMIEARGPLWLALGEAIPGEGVLRAGEWLGPGGAILRAGRRLGLADLLLAEAAGLATIMCHVPRVRLLDAGAAGAVGLSTRLVAAWLAGVGARVETVPVPGRGGAAIRQALVGGAADLVVVIGGTGQGAGDATADAIGAAGELIVHGIGLSSAPTTALGRLGSCPAVALPGAPEAAMAGCLAFLHPVLVRLGGTAPALPLPLPLLRKIASVVGQAELVLLSREAGGWMPLSVGPATPDQFRRAEGWRIVASGDEGWPAGSLFDAGWMEGWTGR